MVDETVNVVEKNVMKECSQGHVSEKFSHSGENGFKSVYRLSPSNDDHNGMEDARDDLVAAHDNETVPNIGWCGLFFKLLDRKSVV